MSTTQERSRTKIDIHIPVSTLMKVVLFALGVAVVMRLAPLLLLLVMAALLAVALEPVLRRIEKYLPRAAGIGLLLLAVIATVAAFAIFVGPSLYTQFSNVIAKLPNVQTFMLNHLPANSMLHKMAEKLMQLPTAHAETLAPQLLDFGQMALESLSSLALIFALTGYLLMDGRRIFHWVLAFFKARNRERLAQTGREITPVVSAYVIGQATTSALCALFVFALCTILHIPAAIFLAVLAGILDIFPIIGFPLSLLPTMVFAVTVSPQTALLVLILYAVYHAVEVYILAPLVYGKNMRMSGLAVLLGLLSGTLIGGIPGALIALPLLASYPIIERIWLSSYLGSGVVTRHARMSEGKNDVQETHGTRVAPSALQEAVWTNQP